MKIIIDSTEYRRDRTLNKENLSRIKDLGKKELIKLEIPWFVYQESTTTSITDLKLELKKTITNLTNSHRKGVHPSDYEKIKKISEEILKIEHGIATSVRKNWAEFIIESKAKLHKFDKDDAEEVFKRYFTGEPPFKSIKNRDDIPDAFIYLTIEKVANGGLINFVSDDNNLISKCEENSNIKCFRSLQELFDSEDYKKIKVKYDTILEKDKSFLDAKEIILNQKSQIENEALNFVNSLSYCLIEDETIKSDNNDATLIGFSTDIINIIDDEIQHIGDEIFIPIEIIGFGLIDYFVFKSDYWIYDDMPKYSEDWNDHYFRIEEEVRIKITKNINFDIQTVIEDEKSDLGLQVDITDFDELDILWE